MKKIILIIAIICTSNLSIAQNFTQLANYEFKNVESYKTEESKVLLCANYLFNNPANVSELNRLTSVQYIMKWMMGTPDYSFEISEESLKITKGNDDLLGLYMAAMTKVVLENKGDKLDSAQIHNQAKEILIAYCSNSENKMKPSKEIKRIIKSRKN
ncbi:hypothetical protein [Pontimicrobium sp. IMCC45349]|uniref:hypothetical protein n=1 Tax=Pontimicrobium sp. IMCC45349 TaxID=3391574 RepID=UPI0039A28D51